MKHAYLQPSSAHRWMTCPGSVALSKGAPDRETPAAARGTRGHEALQILLGTGVLPPMADDPELATWVKLVAKWVTFYTAATGAILLREEPCRVGHAFGCPDDLWGTADIVGVSSEELLIADAKFGFIDVDVEFNPQVSLYAIGKATEYEWKHKRYVLAILQPQTEGRPFKVEVLSREQLLDRYERYKPLVAAALRPLAPLVPTGDGCRWCPVAGACPELHRRAQALAVRAFEEPAKLPVKELARILSSANLIRAALDGAEAYALQALALGEEVPGWKRVATKAHRKWKSEEEAEAFLRLMTDDIYTKTLMSPAQAEKKLGLGRKALDDFAPAPEGVPKLVRADDPRPALAPVFAGFIEKE